MAKKDRSLDTLETKVPYPSSLFVLDSQIYFEYIREIGVSWLNDQHLLKLKTKLKESSKCHFVNFNQPSTPPMNRDPTTLFPLY